jgi:hypothetical protein
VCNYSDTKSMLTYFSGYCSSTRASYSANFRWQEEEEKWV